MNIPLSVLIKALFARDKDAFWWDHFTDEEKELRRMDVWQFAAVIEEASVRPGMEKRRIVAEHMLNVRLAQIQSKASWGSGVLGFVGAIIGAALSVALSSTFQGQNETSRGPTTESERLPIVGQAHETPKPPPQQVRGTPGNSPVGAAPTAQPAVPGTCDGPDPKHPNAQSKP